MSPALRSHFTDYASFHRTPGNQACHYVGIPLIVLSIFALLGRIGVATVGGIGISGAEVLLLVVSLYYVRLDVVLALLMLAASAVLIGAGRFLPLLAAVALFVVGWVFQYIGHYAYEKKAPAFY